MYQDLGLRIALAIFGLLCTASAYTLISAKAAQGIFTWKQAHPKLLRLLMLGTYREGVWSDDELKARGSFKIFTGYLLGFLGLLSLLGAFLPTGSGTEQQQAVQMLPKSLTTSSSTATVFVASSMPSTGYIPVITNDGKSLDIQKDKIIAGHVEADTLSKYFDNTKRADEYAGIKADVGTYYFGPYDAHADLPYNPKLNVVYFGALDRATAGNVNANRAIFSYDLSTKQVKQVVSGYGGGFNVVYLSPDYTYLVYDSGQHGGACSNVSDLKVYNLDTQNPAGSIELGTYESGWIDFGSWSTNSSFTYEKNIITCASDPTNASESSSTSTYVIQ